MILVTGASGQLGNELKKFYSPSEAYFTSSKELDISNYQTCRQFADMHRPSAIINCAAYTKVDLAESEEELCMRVNKEGPENLAKLSAKYQIPLIHISTDFVFDGETKTPYTEADLTNPLSIYGQSKLAGEKAVLQYASTALIIRTSWLYSSFGDNFVKTILKLSDERDSISVISDQHGSPTYAYFLAEAVHQVLPKINKGEKNILHYANEGVATWYELADEIVKRTSKSCKVKPISTEEYPLPAKRPTYSVLDTSAIKRSYNLDIPHWKDALSLCLGKL